MDARFFMRKISKSRSCSNATTFYKSNFCKLGRCCRSEAVMGSIQFGVFRKWGPRARKVLENRWQEIEVLEECICKPKVLRMAYESRPPSFKKACGRPIWPCLQTYLYCC